MFVFFFEHAGCETYSSIDEEIVVHIVAEIIYKIQLEQMCMCFCSTGQSNSETLFGIDSRRKVVYLLDEFDYFC